VTSHPLIQKAYDLVLARRKNEVDLIRVISKIDKQKLFRSTGYRSTFEFCVSGLKLSESEAYAFISVSRKCNEVPQLLVAIQEETLNVSRAKRITSVVNAENAQMWIAKAATLKQRQLETEVVAVNPKEAVRECIKPVSPGRSMLVVGASPNLQEKLARVRELQAQSTGKPCSIEAALESMCELYLEKKDPVRKAQRAAVRSFPKLLVPKAALPSPVENGTRIPIPATLKHLVMQRDQGRCRAKNPDGTACGCGQWIELHHIRPLSQGGTDTLENLVTVCRSHHQIIHADSP
jgi:hypothetical protein